MDRLSASASDSLRGPCFGLGLKAFGLTLFVPLILVSCSHLETSSKPHVQPEIYRSWARMGEQDRYEGFRKLHRFQPLIHGDLLIVGNAIDGVAAYDRKSGQEQWRYSIANGVESGAEISKGRLYFGGSNGFFYCLDALSGKLNWSFPVRAETLSTPRVDGNAVYFLAGNNVLFALDAQTGAQKWLYIRKDREELSIRGGSRPLIFEGSVIAGFSDGNLVALSKESGSVLWDVNLNTNKKYRDMDTDPFLADKDLIVGGYDGSVYSVSASSGKVKWKSDQSGYGSFLTKGSKLFFSSTNDEIVSLDLNSGKLLWKQKLKGLGSSPALYGAYVLSGDSRGSLALREPDTGEVVAEYDTGRGVTSKASVDVSMSRIYIVSAAGNIYSLGVDLFGKRRLWP